MTQSINFPIAEVLPKLQRTLEQHLRVVLEAPPGAGKTTQVPPALLDAPWLAGRKILMLEPRRIAARAAAEFMAAQRGENVGETVGYRIRFEAKVSARTRIEVVTEGILTRMLQDDPTLGEGRAEIGMISRELEPDDATKFPKVHFQATRIGTDALALVVSKDVWQGGVHILSRQQVQGIYEGTITHWKEVGGPDRRIVFFNKEPGRGTWEAFAKWLYGDPKKAPDVSHPEVGANEEGRNKVASTPGSISQLSAAWADQKTVFAVTIRRLDGKVVAPTLATIADGSYPIARPLQVVTDGPPKGVAKDMIDLLLSPRGQALVEKHGYLKAPAAGKSKK